MEKKSLLATLKAMFAGPSEPVRDDKKDMQPESRTNVWGMSGRQAQMQIRNLMQMKAFGRLK